MCPQITQPDIANVDNPKNSLLFIFFFRSFLFLESVGKPLLLAV